MQLYHSAATMQTHNDKGNNTHKNNEACRCVRQQSSHQLCKLPYIKV